MAAPPIIAGTACRGNCSPSATHRPDPTHQPASKLEAAYHRADKAIQQIIDLLAA